MWAVFECRVERRVECRVECSVECRVECRVECCAYFTVVNSLLLRCCLLAADFLAA